MKTIRCDRCGWWWQLTIGPVQRRRWLIWPLRRRRAVLFIGPYWDGRSLSEGRPMTWEQLAYDYADCVNHLAGGPVAVRFQR